MVGLGPYNGGRQPRLLALDAHDLAEGRQEQVEVEALRRQMAHGQVERRAADEVLLQVGHRAEDLADLLEAPVLEQALDELLARVLFLILLGLLLRQHHARLDLQQRRSHDEEGARDLHVHLAHRLEVVEVLARELRDRDVVDVDLVLLDEVHQEL